MVLRRYLKLLAGNIMDSHHEMLASGIVSECADCSLNGEETCCTLRTGFKCDSILLLINLLMEVPLPEFPVYPELCHFLTDKGCCLKARPVICINFTCPRLRENIPFDTLVKVQEITGKEMDALFLIERHIKAKLQTLTIHDKLL